MRALLAGLLLTALAPPGCERGEEKAADGARLGGAVFRLRAARTADERGRALRPGGGPAAGDGVLLAFPRAHFVHLDPTRLAEPLDAAFLGEDAAVAQAARLDPNFPEGATAEKETRLVLLLPAGTFDRNGVRPGVPLHAGGPLPDAAPDEEPVLRLGGREIRPMIAAATDARTRGLMHRPRLSADDGMLFIYPDDRPLEFWMRNTRIPLSIAFLRSDGVVLNVLEMAPLDEGPRYRSSGPAKYALEMNRGWFDGHGVKAGDRVEIPEPVRSLRADP